jgi:hypothetical protein
VRATKDGGEDESRRADLQQWTCSTYTKKKNKKEYEKKVGGEYDSYEV